MQATATREEIVAAIAKKLQQSLDGPWGLKMDQRDMVRDAAEVLNKMYPQFIGTTPEGEEFVADVLYEDAGETWVTVEDIAGYLYDVLTAE